MVWISLGKWSGKGGYSLSWRRIYRKGKWTPFCHIEKRYNTWLGYWKRPRPICWVLLGRIAVFNGFPTNAQEQVVVDLAKPLGLIPTGFARANGYTYELFFEPVVNKCTHELSPGPTPDWKISISDGHAGTASITYRGQELRVRGFRLSLRAGEAAALELDIWPRQLEVMADALYSYYNGGPAPAFTESTFSTAVSPFTLLHIKEGPCR